MTKVSIAYSINSLGLGGGERLLVDLVSHLPQDQFAPHVICLYKAGELAEQLTSIGVPVTVLRVPREIGPHGYRAVYSVLRRGNFQILHAHLLEGCWYGLPAAWMARIPVRIAHLQNCYWQLPLKLRLFDRAAFRFAHAAIGCSQAVVDFYRQRMRYPAEKLHLVYNAVDAARFSELPSKMHARRRLGLSDEDVVITTVASLGPQKGHRYLLEAAKEIVTKLPNARFLLVGDGELRTELENLCERLGLKPWVLFLGNRTDVPGILAASDIFVLPSLWEGLPIVLIEAGLAGLPRVATKVDGIVEVIKDGKNGSLVPPRDPDAIARAILELAQDHKLRDRLGEEGRTFTVSRFDIENTVQQMLAIYRQLLAS